MKEQKVFDKYYARLRKEGIIKSILCGLCVGFGVCAVVALAVFLAAFKGGIWMAIGFGIAAAIIATLAFYFTKFRPTAAQIARRVDGLGLEERAITMLELENDNSYIAMRQREDAIEQLNRTDAKKIGIKISATMIAIACIFGVVGITMTTIDALAEANKVTSPLVPNRDNPDDYLSVSYTVDEGGLIEGEEAQLVFPGDDAETVVAVADDGWVFVQWDDGYLEAARKDTNIQADVIYTAIFQQIGDADGGEGEEGEDGDSGEGEGESGEDEPSEPGESEGEGNGSSSDSGLPGEPDENNQGSGAESDGNKTYNGETSVEDYNSENGRGGTTDDIPPEYGDITDGYNKGFN